MEAGQESGPSGNTQTETFAHELAHVAVGLEHEHDEVWEAAFDAIFKEYNRLGDLKFAKPDDETPGEEGGDETGSEVPVAEGGELTVSLKGNESATLRFTPSADTVLTGLRTDASEPAYGPSDESNPHAHVGEKDAF